MTNHSRFGEDPVLVDWAELEEMGIFSTQGVEGSAILRRENAGVVLERMSRRDARGWGRKERFGERSMES